MTVVLPFQAAATAAAAAAATTTAAAAATATKLGRGRLPTCHCYRFFSAAALRASGHNRWSKIKHDKEKQDSLKTKRRSAFVHQLKLLSQLHGADPDDNPRLATAIAAAKAAGLPKVTIDAAVARGQGLTASGKPLEPMLMEAMIPPSVAVIIDCQAENRLRTLQDIRTILKHHGGSTSSVAYLFRKQGRIVFDALERGLGIADVLDDALDAGAEDIELNSEGALEVYTDPSQTLSIASKLSASLNLKILDAKIVWLPSKETLANVTSADVAEKLIPFVDELQRDPSVRSISMNLAQGKVDDDIWLNLQRKLAA